MRDKHSFAFSADKITMAASTQARYHRERESFWRAEYDKALQTVKQTASVEVREYEVTGGKRADLSVNFGDPTAYQRMQEAYGKIHTHRQSADRLESDAILYGTQGEMRYELSTDDVHYFRLGGGERPE